LTRGGCYVSADWLSRRLPPRGKRCRILCAGALSPSSILYKKKEKKQDCQTYSSSLVVEFLFSTSSGKQKFFDTDMIVTQLCVGVIFDQRLRNLYVFLIIFLSDQIETFLLLSSDALIISSQKDQIKR